MSPKEMIALADAFWSAPEGSWDEDQAAINMAAALRAIAEQMQAAEPVVWIEQYEGGGTGYALTKAGRSLPVGDYKLYTHPSRDTLRSVAEAVKVRAWDAWLGEGPGQTYDQVNIESIITEVTGK
ncbi:hypothetical protein [Chitinolyticbacter meiyuanensis]|uniref:hypothetical protein n=1 Tax=Chitinolyticbacter meiyuanensis TaxID=682798 RepID=UPI0011E5B4C2|nr:hypothetical protein [Chitinolyticbacter meiyuanensis]